MPAPERDGHGLERNGDGGGRRTWGDRLLRQPRLRTVLLAVHLLILLLPLAGIALLRLYDSQLVRRTEAELIVQGAAISAAYRAELRRAAATTGVDLAAWGRPAQDTAKRAADEPFDPAVPGLDLVRHPLLPPAPEARPPRAPADPLALAAGRVVESQLAEIQHTSLAGLRIVDPAGVVVASSGAELGLDLSPRPEVAAALDGHKASVIRRRESDDPVPPLADIRRGTRLRVVVGFPIRGRTAEAGDGERIWGAVILARTPLSVRQALWRERGHLVAGGLVVLGVMGLVTLLTAWTLGRPLEALIRQAERVRRGEKGAAVPLERPGTREVARISRAIAEMARSLEERADYISTFAANVSHEFKTPLTSITGTVELLRDHAEEMSRDERERFLAILEHDARRLQRLVDRLLELARADVIRPGDETADVGAVIRDLAERFEGVEIERSDPARVAMAPETLESVLSNLVDNARHHAENVEIGAQRVDDRVRIEVRDDGPGISRANLPKVFDRFFTTRREEGGSGLGLAIVRVLVEAHGGRVDVASRPGETVFGVSLSAVSLSSASPARARAQGSSDEAKSSESM